MVLEITLEQMIDEGRIIECEGSYYINTDRDFVTKKLIEAMKLDLECGYYEEEQNE